jgi:hypothetical protein
VFPSFVAAAEFKLADGQTVSHVVYTQLHKASFWKSADVEIFHPVRDRKYAKTERVMRHLPVGTRVRINDNLIATRNPPAPVVTTPTPASVAASTPVIAPAPSATLPVVVEVPWYRRTVSVNIILGIILLILTAAISYALGSGYFRRKTHSVSIPSSSSTLRNTS